MVGKEETRAIDQQIKEAEQALTELPEPLRKRVVTLKLGPREVISRINQINGLIIEFEEIA